MQWFSKTVNLNSFLTVCLSIWNISSINIYHCWKRFCTYFMFSFLFKTVISFTIIFIFIWYLSLTNLLMLQQINFMLPIKDLQEIVAHCTHKGPWPDFLNLGLVTLNFLNWHGWIYHNSTSGKCQGRFALKALHFTSLVKTFCIHMQV